MTARKEPEQPRPIDWKSYLIFLQLRRRDLQRVARHSHGVYQLGDVEGEILITAEELSQKIGTAIDFADQEQGGLLIAYTYQRLLRYGDTVLICANSMDSSSFGGPSIYHESLTNGSCEDPIEIIENAKAAFGEPDEQHVQQSLGGTWHKKLLECCNNRMSNVAYLLKLSLSHTYRCYNRVLMKVEMQRHLPLVLPDGRGTSARPWRRSRLHRVPVQLAFDFEESLPFSDDW